MQSRSTIWDTYIQQSHTVCTKVEVLYDGEIQYTFEGENSLVIEGQIGYDIQSAIRSSASITLEDPTGAFVPSEVTSLLAPYGTEIRCYRGIQYTDGTKEYMSLGIFPITTVSVNDSGPSLGLRIEASDRAEKVSRAKFLKPYGVANGTFTDTAIKDIINQQTPGYDFDLAGNIHTTPSLLWDMADDPWAACQTLAQNAGNILYFNQQGTVVMRPISDYSADDVIWSFTSDESGSMGDVATVYSTGGDSDGAVYNHVVVTGEPVKAQAQVRAEAFDNNPNSPTYYRGPFGDVPAFYSSNQITSSTQAQNTADAMLHKYLGRYRSVNFGTVVNPALELGDIVSVDRTASGLNNFIGVVERISIPLVASRNMDVTVRQRPA